MNPVTRRLRRVLLAAAVLALVTAFGASARLLATVSFDVPATAYTSNTGYFPFVVADKKGYFERNGVNPRFIASGGGGIALRAFTASDAPIGIEGLPSTLPAIEAGGEFKIIGQISRSSDTWVVVKSDSTIRTLGDIRGKRIGVSGPGSTLESIALGMVRRAGLQPSDVKIEYLGTVPNILVALDRGLIDVAAGAGQVQLYHHTKTLKDWRLLGRGGSYTPVIDAVIVAKTSFIRSNPDQIRGFMRAIVQGRNYIIGNRNSADLSGLVTEWQSITDSTFQPAVRAMIAELGRGENAEEYFGDLTLDMKTMREIAEGLVRTGRLRAVPRDWSRFIDTRFSAAAANRLVGLVGPTHISMRKPTGPRVQTVKQGTYTISVEDLTTACNFVLRGPGVRKATTGSFRGTVSWRLRLYPGTYRYACTTKKNGPSGVLRVTR